MAAHNAERKDKVSASQKRLNNVTKKLVARKKKSGDERAAKVELATKNVGHDLVD